MKRFSCWIIISLTLYFACVTFTQAEDTPDCQNVPPLQPASAAIVQAFSSMIGFNVKTNSYRFIVDGSDRPNIDLPNRNNGDPYLQHAILSPGGDKLLGVYIDTYRVASIVLIDVLTGARHDFSVSPMLSNAPLPSFAWLDENNVVFAAYDFYNPNPVTFFLLDTLTGIQFPLYVEVHNAPIVTSVPRLMPNLKDVLYVGLFPNSQSTVELINYHIETAQYDELLSLRYINDAPVVSASPDGKLLAVAHNPGGSGQPQTLTLLDTQGQVIAEESLSFSRNTSVYPDTVQWSPSGDKFLYKNGKLVAYNQILDINTGSVVNTCLDGTAYWSPDSHYVAVIQWTEPTETSPSVLKQIAIYDVAAGVAYEVQGLNLDNIGTFLGWGK